MADLRAPLFLRALRGSVTAAVAMLLAVWGHTAAGGLLPGLGWLLLIAMSLALVSAAALARPASRWRLVALVAGGQFCVHVVLTALSGHKGDPSAQQHSLSVVPTGPSPRTDLAGSGVAGPDRSGSFYDLTMAPGAIGRPGEPALDMPHWVTHVLTDLTGPHALMALAHLLAAAGVACWLAVGETALWTLIVLLSMAAGRLVRRVVALHVVELVDNRRPPGIQPRDEPRQRLPIWLLASSLSRRGPPAANPCCVALRSPVIA